MKNLTLLTTLVISLTAFNAMADGLTCTTNSAEISSLTLNLDGGEETVSVSYQNKASERFLVIQHTKDGKIVAIEDNAITGGNSNKGLALVLNPTTGKGYIAHQGEIHNVICAGK